MLGQLASGVGHELRNPLGVMSNAIYYLQLVQPDAAPEVKEYLGILQQQVALSGKIVSDLLDFARVTPVQREAVTLHSLVAAQRSRLPELDSIQLEADLPESLPLAQVDPVHAGQVIFNLLTNAIQAMGPGGRLRLRGSHHSGGHLQLEVSDNGPGVPPEIGDKVFEPLFTTKARGIGLGLAVSRSLAQANGGELYLHPSGGAGATFVFTMPTAGAQA
jgi:signal transduction histidine kinase